MNLYLRLLWALLRSLRLRAIEPGDWIERRLRVWPNDLDINGHMNNGRYLTLVDLMLVEYFVRSGFAKVMLKAGWRPMSGGAFITYRKGLLPGQRYRLRFVLAGADEAWNYMRFEFRRDDGTLCAAGYMKGAAVGRKGPGVWAAEIRPRVGPAWGRRQGAVRSPGRAPGQALQHRMRPQVGPTRRAGAIRGPGRRCPLVAWDHQAPRVRLARRPDSPRRGAGSLPPTLRVPNAQSYARLGRRFEQGALPPPVQHWLAAEAGVMALGTGVA